MSSLKLAKTFVASCFFRAAILTDTAAASSGAPLTHSSGQARTTMSTWPSDAASSCTTLFSPTWVNGQLISAKTSRRVGIGQVSTGQCTVVEGPKPQISTGPGVGV